MSWTGDPTWLAEVLRGEGLRVVEFPGWRERGHGDFGDLWGIVCHHTGGSNTPPSEIAYGLPHLAGPLSQIHLSRDGTVTVIAVGVAWHAGVGSWPGLPEDNANFRTIGIEAANNGTEGWSQAQYAAYVGICAAICRRLGYGADRVIGHKEWAGPKQGKWDPGAMDMNAFRRDVQAQIEHKAPRKGPGKVFNDEMIRNRRGQDINAGDMIAYLDEHTGQTLDQLGGPGTCDGKPFPGWTQLGGRTVVDALAAVGAALGIDGFADPKAGK
uniref:N-acetylmuramoyl-L-alanine amidase n=1 Tax=Nocardia suismassiliense TaxID=2077092 RepID=UPI003F4934C0